MLFEHISIQNIESTLEILRQDMLRNPQGYFHGPEWISKIITDGYAIGGFIDNKMIVCLLAEELIDSGIMIWFIAVSPDYQGCGYGSDILKYFENFCKKNKKNWIFLNATENSLDFYNKNKYTTSKFSKVYEHLKEF